MNQYQYLAGKHDLSLPDWGPYAGNYFGISHLADKARGSRFDYLMVPGIYRRELFVPDTLKECGLSPRDASADLNFYSYRQQIEAKDKIYADISYSRIDDHFRLGRCNFVNTVDHKIILVLHHFAGLFFRYDGELRPVLPESSSWIVAVDCEKLEFAKPRYDDALTWDGHRRSEEMIVPGSVSGNCIGKGFWQTQDNCFEQHRRGHGFGYDAGDAIRFHLDSAVENGFIQLRYKLEAGKLLKLKVSNAVEQESELIGSGEFETVVIYQGKIIPGMLEIVSGGGCEITLDGLVAGQTGNEAKTMFVPAGLNNTPVIENGPVKNSSIISYDCLDHAYGLWWSYAKSVKRTFSSNNLIDTLNHSYPIRNPYSLDLNFGSKEKYAEVFMIPIVVEPDSRTTIYSIVGDGAKPEIVETFARLPLDSKSLEQIYEKNSRASLQFNTTDTGKKFTLGQKLMASVTLTNITYPIYTKRSFIRHHTPARYYNSLYTWDAGFVGLGLLELDKRRAIENLNVYVTEPGDEESAFILHGTPVPVQAYLYEEIWNRFQDRAMLEFFYPRLKHYYNFLAGHARSSTTRTFKSELLKTWDYFYNSGGWDDYPPQWEIFLKQYKHISPAVSTSHAIRFAKILSMAAAELGLAAEVPYYQQDIAIFSNALQKYAWDEQAGYFSYVCHDAQGNPSGFFRDASGLNFNMGLDGLTPLLAGICTPEQTKILFDKLQSPEHFFTPIGLSAVDISAPYYREDGYWNGSVWMPHQWFFWKSALDHGMTDLARKIAMTALNLWKRETDETYYCFEHFAIDSGRGCMAHNFSGLSCPVLNWFNAYFTLGRITGGFDTWIKKIENSSARNDSYRFELNIGGYSDGFTTLIFVSGPGSFQAEYNGSICPAEQHIAGTMEIQIPKKSRGFLIVRPIRT